MPGGGRGGKNLFENSCRLVSFWGEFISKDPVSNRCIHLLREIRRLAKKITDGTWDPQQIVLEYLNIVRKRTLDEMDTSCNFVFPPTTWYHHDVLGGGPKLQYAGFRMPEFKHLLEGPSVAFRQKGFEVELWQPLPVKPCHARKLCQFSTKQKNAN